MLAEASGTLARLRAGTEQAERTLAALHRLLRPELRNQAWGASLKDGTLTVLVRSAAWGTRLRYEGPKLCQALAVELAAPVERIQVKVRAAPH